MTSRFNATYNLLWLKTCKQYRSKIHKAQIWLSLLWWNSRCILNCVGYEFSYRLFLIQLLRTGRNTALSTSIYFFTICVIWFLAILNVMYKRLLKIPVCYFFLVDVWCSKEPWEMCWVCICCSARRVNSWCVSSR